MLLPVSYSGTSCTNSQVRRDFWIQLDLSCCWKFLGSGFLVLSQLIGLLWDHSLIQLTEREVIIFQKLQQVMLSGFAVVKLVPVFHQEEKKDEKTYSYNMGGM